MGRSECGGREAKCRDDGLLHGLPCRPTCMPKRAGQKSGRREAGGQEKGVGTGGRGVGLARTVEPRRTSSCGTAHARHKHARAHGGTHAGECATTSAHKHKHGHKRARLERPVAQHRRATSPGSNCSTRRLARERARACMGTGQIPSGFGADRHQARAPVRCAKCLCIRQNTTPNRQPTQDGQAPHRRSDDEAEQLKTWAWRWATLGGRARAVGAGVHRCEGRGEPVVRGGPASASA